MAKNILVRHKDSVADITAKCYQKPNGKLLISPFNAGRNDSWDEHAASKSYLEWINIKNGWIDRLIIRWKDEGR